MADFETYSSWGLWVYLQDLGLMTKCVSTEKAKTFWDSCTIAVEYSLTKQKI